MTDPAVAATCKGVKVPQSPFLTETRIRRIEGARYEGEEIAGALSVIRPGDRVLEMGAGLGIVGAVAALNAKPAAVLSFEANPEMIPHIKALHRLNGLERRMKVRNEVLLTTPDQPATVPFHLHNSFLGSSLTPAPGRRRVDIPTADFSRVRKDFQPDVLIMDIEGGELDFLEHADLSGIRAVVIEFHPKVYGKEGAQRCKTVLRRAGFAKQDEVSTRFVWTCTRDVSPGTPPDPAGGWSTEVIRLDAPQVMPPTTSKLVQHAGLLDARGRPVAHGALWRNRRLLTAPPVRPETPPEPLPGRWLWGGVLWRYFPHFITESVTTLWALDALDEPLDGLLFIPKRPGMEAGLAGFHRQFFELMGITLPVQVATTPRSPEYLVVPGQGFGLGAISTGTDAFRHMMATRFAPDVAPEGPERLYISRSKLGAGRGALLGESVVEEQLAARGYEIFHPQDHDLATQVARYRAARQIVAAEGSALHFYAHAGRPGQQVAMILRRKSGATDHISEHIRSFTGNTPVWIDALRRTWRRADNAQKRLSIGEPDFAGLQSQLVANGFIAPGPAWPQPDAAALQAELGPGYLLETGTPA